MTGVDPLVDVFTVPVPDGPSESPLQDRHVIDMHLGGPVRAWCRMDSREVNGVQSEGTFCVLPAGEIGRWMMARPASALILRLTSSVLEDTAEAMGLSVREAELAPSIHLRDPQIERIAWILRAEQEEAH